MRLVFCLFYPTIDPTNNPTISCIKIRGQKIRRYILCIYLQYNTIYSVCGCKTCASVEHFLYYSLYNQNETLLSRYVKRRRENPCAASSLRHLRFCRENLSLLYFPTIKAAPSPGDKKISANLPLPIAIPSCAVKKCCTASNCI